MHSALTSNFLLLTPKTMASSRLFSIFVLFLGFLFLQQAFVSPSVARAPRVLLRATGELQKANEETTAKCQEVIAEQLGVDKEKVVREATLTELGADSLDIVESVMALEEAFDVELPDDETTSLKNVGDVADLIETKRND